jgi:hypothetical protein
MSDDCIGGCHTVCYTTGKVNRLKVFTNRAEHNMCACHKEETSPLCEDRLGLYASLSNVRAIGSRMRMWAEYGACVGLVIKSHDMVRLGASSFLSALGIPHLKLGTKQCRLQKPSTFDHILRQINLHDCIMF